MQERDDIKAAVVLPRGAAAALRSRWGLSAECVPKLAFMAGPGDVVGSYEQWLQKRHDPRVPVLTYAAQFFSLVAALGAQALVVTATPDRPAQPDPHFRFVCVPRDSRARGLAWHRAEYDYARRLADAITPWGPDATILGGDLKPTVYQAIARKGRLFLTLHNGFWPMGQRPRSLRHRLRHWALGRALARAEAAVCTSAECARQFRELAGAGGNTKTEMPQVLAAHLAPQRPRMRARRLLFLGRIEADKGIFDLLDAFGPLAARFKDARLVLAGSGSADGALREAIARHPARTQIEFAGLLDAAGVHDALCAADLLICPTRSAFAEGLALVVLEAAAQGVPSVASSVVPAAETAGAACATYPADDAQALGATLARLMSDDASYRALAAQADQIRPLMLDRDLGWGSCLARLLIR